MIPSRIGKGCFFCCIRTCLRNIKAVVGEKLAEAVFVLKNAYRLIRSECRKTHFLLYVGGCDNAGVNAKRHDAVNLMLTSYSKNCFLVDNAYIDVFIGVSVRYIVGNIIASDDIVTETMCRLNYR